MQVPGEEDECKRQKEEGKGKKAGLEAGGKGEESLMPGLVERPVVSLSNLAVEEMVRK